MKRLYLIDFDRTLFDTASFQVDLFRALTQGNSESEATFVKTIPDYSNPDTGFYDFFEHASSHTGLNREQILARVEKHLAHDYTFPDAPACLNNHVNDQIVIVTVGGKGYQELKFRHSPSLKHMPRHVISGNKGRLLTKELAIQTRPPYSISLAPGSFDEIILVDDVPVHLEHMPVLRDVSGIRLVRDGGKYSHLPSPAGVRTIRNLGEL